MKKIEVIEYRIPIEEVMKKFGIKGRKISVDIGYERLKGERYSPFREMFRGNTIYLKVKK